MFGLSDEVMGLVQQLLPGFIAAWVFYGLTAHPRKSPFERVVQALIFTIIIKTLVTLIHLLAVRIGMWIRPWGEWSEDSEFLFSVLLALGIGLSFAGCANCNLLHHWLGHWPMWESARKKFKWLPSWRWTSRTSFPSEWFSAFTRQSDRWVVLHLRGGRRIYGFPEEWPDQAKAGHFVLIFPEWLLEDGRRAPLLKTSRFLVHAASVEMAEILYNEGEASVDESQVLAVQKMLVDYNVERSNDGNEESATAPKHPPDQRGGKPANSDKGSKPAAPKPASDNEFTTLPATPKQG